MFKRRKLDEALAAHLDNYGIRSDWWLDAAKQAIAAVEAGDSVAPIISSAGPVPARTVLMLMRLGNFVDAPTDWETPILDGTERGQWFYPPNDDVELNNTDAIPKLTNWFFPSEDEEGMRYVDPALWPRE